MKRGIHTMHGQDNREMGGEPRDQRLGGRERHEHRQAGPLVDEQRHVRSPKQCRRIPIAQRGRGQSARGCGTAAPVEDLLGRKDHKHNRQSRVNVEGYGNSPAAIGREQRFLA